MKTFALSLVLVAVASLTSSAQLVRLKEHHFELGGLDRNYLLYTPRNATKLPGKRPLVLVLHGGGGTARQMVRGTNRRFHALADRDGFYVIYPNADQKMWDFGEGKISQERKRRVDDLSYFRTIINQSTKNHPIDPKRVFATGISRGGQACYFLAGKLPNQIRAIAPVTMPIPAFLADDCAKGPPMPLLLINGTGDPLVPYEGGQIKVFEKERGKVLSTDETINLFRRRNRCPEKPATIDIVDPKKDQTKVIRTSWQSAARAPIVLCRIENGGHTWPSGPQYLPEKIVGKVSRDIDGAVEAWSFFAQFK